MLWSLVFLLSALTTSGQEPAAAQSGSQAAQPRASASQATASPATGHIPAGWRVTNPERRDRQRCMNNLGADGTANSQLTVRCETVQNGEPKNCRLETGQDQPVRHRAAARCIAPLYRFSDASGQPANGGPVTIPVSFSIEVTNFY